MLEIQKCGYRNTRKFNTLSDDCKIEFNNNRAIQNIERCKIFSYVILFIHLLLLIMNLIIYSPIGLELNNLFRLYYSHILLFIFTLVWLIFLKLSRNRKSIRKLKFHCRSFTIIILYWHVLVGLNNVYVSGANSNYVICILAISICLFLTPMEAFLICFISLALFIIGINFIVPTNHARYSLIMSSTVPVIISFIISKFKYIYFLEDFINKKDLIESKRELELTNKKLKEYEKLRTDFFANISHELKTPINVISCAQQMMEVLVDENHGNNTNTSKYLKMIKQNSYRLIRLVGNIIDITKIDAFNFEVKLVNMDIIKVIEDITMSVVTFVEAKGLSITFDTYIEEKIIACDPNQVERIILNLLSNSVKFTNKGGKIFINIYTEHNNVCISVKDTGIGIPDNMKDLIFDRFVQVDKSTSKNSEGCGIGLSLVKSLVEMQGGRIEVNSSIGEGSEFIVMLPDITLDENTFTQNPPIISDDNVKKISIEFSDIYD